MPAAVKTLAVAYGVAAVAAGATALALVARAREAAGTGTPISAACLVPRTRNFVSIIRSLGLS